MKQASDYDLQLGKMLGSAALGALVMYMLDPDRGAPRRAQSGEKLRDLGRQTGDAFEKVVQSFGNRVGGAASAATGAADRIGSAASEAGDKLAATAREAASAVQADGAASQAGQSPQENMPQQNFASSPQSWSPSLRNAAMLGGGGLGLYSIYSLMARRSPLAMLLGVAGVALLAGGAGRHPLRSLGLGGRGSHMVDVEKSIRIEASPEQVYQLWSDYENFPHFMANVVDVRDLGDRRSHWVVKGPAGTEFEWDAVLTEQDRPHRLAWASAPGSEVEQYGSVLLEPTRGGTRATVRMRYRPPAGAAGQAVATLLGRDPKRELEEDLGRMKAMVEGKLGRAAQPSASEGKFLH